MSDSIAAASVFVPQTPSGDETRRRLAGRSPTEVAKEFEAVLLAQVISAMRKTVPDSGMLESSVNRKMLDGAFDQEVARSLAGKGGLGIAEQIVGQIERQQAVRDAQAGRDGIDARDGTTARDAAGRTVSTASVGMAPSAARPVSRTMAAAHAPSAAVVATKASVFPVEGEVSSPFGMRIDPFTGEERFHAGVDVAAPRGAHIRAVADGEVVFSGWKPGGAGRVVEVRHADGLVTSYAHAERTLVRVGQHVDAGTVVATVGSSGRSSGPHLHFAAARNGQPVDPSPILRQGRAVLGSMAALQERT